MTLIEVFCSSLQIFFRRFSKICNIGWTKQWSIYFRNIKNFNKRI